MHEPVRTQSNIGRIATVLPGLYHLKIENEAVRCIKQALIQTRFLSHTSQPAAQNFDASSLRGTKSMPVGCRLDTQSHMDLLSTTSHCTNPAHPYDPCYAVHVEQLEANEVGPWR